MEFNLFVAQFAGYIHSHGHDIDNWCVGITSDPEIRLFKEHKIRSLGLFLFDDAKTKQNAYNTVKELLKDFEILNVSDDNDIAGTWVYIYKITDYSNP